MGVAGSIVANLVTKNDKWNKGFASAQSVVNKLAAGVTAFAAIGVQRLTVVGDQLDKMSMRTGVSVQSLSQLKFAVEQSGGSLEELEKGFFGLSRSVFDAQRGSKTASDSLDRLGLSIDDLSGQSAEQQMMAVADGMTAITDESTRGAIAQQLFGRAGRQLLPLFADGSRGINKLRQEADDLGLSMTAAQAALGARLTDALNRAKRATEALSMKVGAVFIPILEKAANFTAMLASGSGDWVDVAIKAGAVVVGLAVGMKAYTVATTLWTKAQAIALAFQGPAGWAQLAAGVAIATASYTAITYALNDSNESLAKSSTATANATGIVDGHTSTLADNADAMAAMPAANAAVTRSMALVTLAQTRYQKAVLRSNQIHNQRTAVMSGAIQLDRHAGKSVEELARHYKNVARGNEIYTRRIAANVSAQTALATNTEGLSAALGDQETQADKLGQALLLLKQRAAILKDVEKFGAVDDNAFADLDAIRDRTIDKLTGFGDHLGSIRDEVERLKGTATDASLALRDMAADGVPADKIAELKTAYDQLAKLKSDKNAEQIAASAADKAKQTAEQKLAQQSSLADNVRQSIQSPLDALKTEVAGIQSLVSDRLLSQRDADKAIAQKVAELPPDFAATVAAGIAKPVAALTPATPLERFGQSSDSDDRRVQLLEATAARLREQIASGKLTTDQANARLSSQQDRLRVPDAPVVESQSLADVAREQRAAIREDIRRGEITNQEAKARFREIAKVTRDASRNGGKSVDKVGKVISGPLDKFKAMAAAIDKRVADGALSDADAKIEKQLAKGFALNANSDSQDTAPDNDSRSEARAVSTTSSEGTRVLAGILNRRNVENDQKALKGAVDIGNDWAAESAGYLQQLAKNFEPIKTKSMQGA